MKDRRRRRDALWVVCLGLALVLPAQASAQRLALPLRPPEAMTGSAFARSIEHLEPADRDARIVSEILQGNVPDGFRVLHPVRLSNTDGSGEIEFWVTPDYLAVGADADYLLTPMTPQAAQRIADALQMSLPTPKMVDAIWAEATFKMMPEPIPPSPAMTTVPVFLKHSRAVEAQRRRMNVSTGALVAGHKKDIVVSAGLSSNPNRVAIYGWHQPDGEPIQPLYLGHTDAWVDYSHGVRLVRRTILVDGKPMDLWAALQDPAIAPRLSRAGVVEQPWYTWP